MKTYLQLCCGDKILKIINLHEGNVHFGSQFHHGHLAPVLWASGEVAHHGGSRWQDQVAHLRAARKQKERKEGAGITIIPFKGTSPVTSLPSTRPYLLKAPPLPSSATVLWPRQSQGLKDIPDPNHSTL
jgi:hypothetical protein